MWWTMIGRGGSAKSATRKQKSEAGASTSKSKKEVRRDAIARTAFELFMEQGYEKTTMRQIAYRAKILNGSLYNLFPSKDEIFDHIMMRAIELRHESCTSMIEEEKDYLYALALPFVVELYACGLTPKVSELLHEAYGNWNTFDKITDLDIGWLSQVSERFGLALDQERLKQNIVAIDGCLAKLVDRYVFTEDSVIQEDVRTLLIVMFTLLNLPLHGIDHLTQRFDETFNSPDAWDRFTVWPDFNGE